MPAATRLSLTDFRSYPALRLELDRQPVVLTGPNGAGKTNLLEALSFLSPGRGLRRARLAEVARLGSAGGWAVAARLETSDGAVDIGTTTRNRDAGSGAERRSVRIDGRAASGPAALAATAGVQWLTPQMDRLFLEAAVGRRRFLDRLVFGFDPGHARRVSDYQRTLGERARLLRSRQGDGVWLGALEAQMSAHAVAVAASRREAIGRLEQALAGTAGALPPATVRVVGTVESWLDEMPALQAEARLTERLRQSRPRDAEAGGAAEGPHKSDLAVRHAGKDVPANLCSTGEQKALLCAIVLANARLEATRRGAPPILLLDEVAAHLDEERRWALFHEVLGLGGQAWLSGTDAALFRPLAGRAQFLAVSESHVRREE